MTKNIIRERVENFVVRNSERGHRITFQALTEQLAYTEKGSFFIEGFAPYGPYRYEAKYRRAGGDRIVVRFYELGEAIYLESLEYIDFREVMGL